MLSAADFKELAGKHRIIPLTKRLVADMATPVAAFMRVVENDCGFLLESVESERWSRFSFIGRKPLARFLAYKNKVTIESSIGAENFSGIPTDQGMLAFLEQLFNDFTAPEMPELGVPFFGGVAGYLGYDIVREIEDIPDQTKDDRELPDAIMELIGELVVFDHFKQQVLLVENVLIPEGAGKKEISEVYENGVARLEELCQAGTRKLDEPLFEAPDLFDVPISDFKRSISAKDFEIAVEAVKERIYEGDIIQAVLSERFDFPLAAEPLDVYRVLRQINPSPYMFFLRYEDLVVLGASPETLVKVLDNRVISRPIAGTRKRGGNELEDQKLAAELIEDPKEKAEHIMLVDLARNDVGKVVEYGSLEVEDLMMLERYSHVMHLTSQVAGDLRQGLTSLDVLRATFPHGTISGAPKIRAMEIIDEMEPVRRGPYSGMVGYLDFSGNLDSAIAIRTMVCKKQLDGKHHAYVQAGAGIVLDSVPETEQQECENKAKALMTAVTSAQKMAKKRKAK